MSYVPCIFSARKREMHPGIDWLHAIPNPDHNDMGYGAFISQIDALVMGRTTFETVCGFDMDWPYQQPVFVLSNRMSTLPEEYVGKAELVRGSLPEIVDKIHAQAQFSDPSGESSGTFL